MDRNKVINAILAVSKLNPTEKQALSFTLKYVPDMNLIVLANDLGIDTDELLGSAGAL